MKSNTLTRSVLVAAVSGLALTMTACGSDTEPAASESSSAAAPSTSSSSAAAPTTEAMAMENFGAGCAAVPADGPGSFQGMSTAPVATAASANPVLSTLVTAVQAAGLVDTLNGLQDVTVFAPANPAFEAIPSDALNAVLADVPQLTTVLQHHVHQGRLTPEELSAAPVTTLAGGDVTVSGSGEAFTISGDQTLTGTEANVICGNVQTANATVYIIDQVLKPVA